MNPVNQPISYLQNDAGKIVRDLSENREPVFLTQDGDVKLVLMDIKSYEEQAQTLALLKILALGNREIEEGKFRDAEEVFADLEKDDLA
jgi:PHD/YefM family antitoxin component YafN of YafNO toxin-antitoxin module